MITRNQRHGELLDESSIFLELHGLESSGMALGKMWGFARDEKTKTHKRHTIASYHLKRAGDIHSSQYILDIMFILWQNQRN